MALHCLGSREAGGGEEGGGEVDVGYEFMGDGAGRDGLGVAGEEGHADGFFVHHAFVEPAVVAEEEALVGGVDDEGVVAEVVVIEIVEEAADVVVDGADAAEIVFDVELVGPFAEGVAFEIWWAVDLRSVLVVSGPTRMRMF